MRLSAARSGGMSARSAKVLVNGVTAGAIALAALSCWLLVAGATEPAFLLVVLAMTLDMLDGPLARMMGAQSKLGVWLDTCGDFFSYLIFPSIYWWTAYEVSPWVLAVFFAAGAFRLIRFSLLGFVEEKGKVYYAGMPVFYNQLLLVLTYLVDGYIAWFGAVFVSVLLLACSVLMVSTIPFRKIPVRVLAGALVFYVVIVVGRILGVW